MSTKSEISGGPPLHLSESLFAYVEPGTHRRPDKLAVVSKGQPGNHLSEAVREATGSLPRSDDTATLRWTFKEFFGVSFNLAENLAQQTADSEALMITFIPNSVEYLLLLSASTIAKVGIANLDVGMLQKARHAELEAYIRQLQPSCIVVPDAEGASAVDKILRGLQLPRVVKISLDSSSSSMQEANTDESGWQNFTALCKVCPPAAIEARAEAARHDDRNRTALVVYTSGTSGGMPKGCLKHVSSLLTSVMSQTFNRPGSESESVRIVQTANFRAIAPLVIIRAWHDGATIVLAQQPFSAEKYLDDIEQELVTELVLIPAQLHAIAASPSLGSRDFRSVELIGSGGDIVNLPVIKLGERTFPTGTFMTGHGMSECSGIFQWPYWGGSASIPFYQGISPVGRPSAGAKLRLVSEEGEIVPIGEVGELHVQHGSVFKGYLRERKDMPEFYTDEGGDWFITGDLGVFTKSDDVYIVGRKKDVVKRAGVSIAPAAIESCLSTYAGSQTVVVGVPHPTLGQEAIAILASFNGRSAEDIAGRVIEMFGPDWQLGGVIEMKALGLQSFPLNATSKVQKSELAPLVDEYLKSK